jgi:dTDP-L-rhamnose 4-epimerase
MKILIVGGAGFIGSRTAQALSEKGHEVIIVDNFDIQTHGSDRRQSPTAKNLWKSFQIHELDAIELGNRPELWVGVDVLLYLASSTGTGQSMYELQAYAKNNVAVAAALGEQILNPRNSVSKVVVSGTRAVYGEGAAVCSNHGRVYPSSRPADQIRSKNFNCLCPSCKSSLTPVASLESDPPRPVSMYGITKLSQEQIIQNACETRGIPCKVLRYQNVYGPGQSLQNPYTGILSIFTQLMRQGAEINIFEDGLSTRDFVYIDDVVDCNLNAIGDGGRHYNLLNVGSGTQRTIIQVVECLARTLSIPARYNISGQARIGDIRNAQADIARVQEAYGINNFIEFEEGVRRFVEWAMSEPSDDEVKSRYEYSLSKAKERGVLK